jgi:hypothetical protein
MDAIDSGQFCGHDFSRVCGLSLLYVVRVITRRACETGLSPSLTTVVGKPSAKS